MAVSRSGWISRAVAVGVVLSVHGACTGGPPGPGEVPSPSPVTTTTTLPPVTLPPAPSPSPSATCDDHLRPAIVVITAPPENTLVGNDSLTIEVYASDNIGVTKVEFLYHIDQAGLTDRPSASFDPPILIGTRTSLPYRLRWSVPRMCRAKVSLLAWAYDACDNVGESLPQKIEICN